MHKKGSSKILLFGGLFAIVGPGIGKFNSHTSRLEYTKDTLDGLQNAFDSFVFLNRIGLMVSDEQVEKREEQKTLRNYNKLVDKQKEKDATKLQRLKAILVIKKKKKKEEIKKRHINW